MSDKKPKAVFATLLALLALGLSGFAVSQVVEFSGSWKQLGDAEVETLPQRLDRLETELAELRGTWAIAAGNPQDANFSDSTQPVSWNPAGAPNPELVARLAAIEKGLAELDEARQGLRKVIQPLVSKEADSLAVRIADYQERTLDPAQSDADRVLALRRLSDLPNGRTEAVARAMIELADETDDISTRSDILRQLRGLEYAFLRDPLLNYMSQDSSDEVRQQAVAALEVFAADPIVAEGLQQALDSDPSPEVRAQAQEALGTRN